MFPDVILELPQYNSIFMAEDDAGRFHHPKQTEDQLLQPSSLRNLISNLAFLIKTLNFPICLLTERVPWLIAMFCDDNEESC